MKYEIPLIQIIELEIEDIITSSSGLIIGDDLSHEDKF